MSGLLSGMRVIESSMLLNGASTSMMLADLGAEAIKVESPVMGDYLRLDATAHLNAQAKTDKLGIGYAALPARKPGLAYCQNAGFGASDTEMLHELGYDDEGISALALARVPSASNTARDHLSAQVYATPA